MLGLKKNMSIVVIEKLNVGKFNASVVLVVQSNIDRLGSIKI